MTVQPRLLTARVERVLPAPPADAYDAWLQEDALRDLDTGDLESIVTVVFAPHGKGETLMTITHSKQPAQLVEKHRAGWSSVADQIQASLALHR